MNKQEVTMGMFINIVLNSYD